ncbi:MmcB family DNA repair protein [Aliarcobacter butzleri]|uniref:MmcB family DNA repair protein n=1 Tax=Aliarcobacter butzleri TaxID=28197 RepID=A0AAW6VIW5_9BACT|nr:MmcB family DNA repair protein [Aliarcobacter butzleri]MDK2042083.1 MmcB family DNA repair protein [Aliarcobacter butzleri]MDK2097302.1 MmcB family DNA repair protein [Aliarcobacter butzleri]
MKELKAKELVIKYLLEKNKHDIAIPEISVGKNNSVRSDIFAINGDITIYEIKTEADSLTRLDNQLKYYRQYANKIYVVVDKKFLNKLKINDNIGIYELKENTIKLLREAVPFSVKTDHYLDYWWTKEYKEILRGISGFSKINNHVDGRNAIKSILTDEEIKNLTLFRLKERYKNESEKIKKAIAESLTLSDIFKKREYVINPKVTPLKDIPFGELRTISLQGLCNYEALIKTS